jgi:hypothetical protein
VSSTSSSLPSSPISRSTFSWTSSGTCTLKLMPSRSNSDVVVAGELVGELAEPRRCLLALHPILLFDLNEVHVRPPYTDRVRDQVAWSAGENATRSDDGGLRRLPPKITSLGQDAGRGFGMQH